MKSAKLMCIQAVVLVAALTIPVQMAAQDKQDQKPQHHHYQLIDPGTFGGPQSSLWVGTEGGPAQSLNNQGILVGWADTSMPDPYPNFCFTDCFVSHAFQWQKGVLTDLGSLANSSLATWIGDTGLISGISQNGETDPLIPGFPETRAVLWKDGQVIDLGTFGGNESIAQSGNNRGQVVGGALNTTPDPFSFIDLLFLGSSNGTQTRAFLWENGAKRDLGTLGGPDALASYVNQHGQVAGWSYTNSTPNPLTGVPTFHPFLWEKGKGMKDLGTLGGTQTYTQNGLNERGQMIGSMTLADEVQSHPFFWDGEKLMDLGTFGGLHGDATWLNDAGEVVGWAGLPSSCPTNEGAGHAFLWRNGVKTDLGTLSGTDNSDAFGINSKSQIVGISFTCDNSVDIAALWEKGSMVDLNTLVPPNSALYLYLAFYINENGEIAGFGVDSSSNSHAFLLIPCDENHSGVEGCDYSLVDATALQQAPAPPGASSRTSGQPFQLPRARFPFRNRILGRP